MSPRRSKSRPRPSERRWHIPPPLVHGSEALEGAAVLGENPSVLGGALWQALRDVMLWAQTPPAARDELFHAEAAARRHEQLQRVELPAEAGEGLAVLADLLATPSRARSEPIALACRAIARWAEGEGRLATALAFAQDAALAVPGDAEAALAVARLARTHGDFARAEVWYRRAIGLARQARDWRTYSRAFRGLGNLYVRRGNFPAAERLHVRALRGARRGGMRSEQALTLHDMFVISAEAGRSEDAERYARQAYEAYGTRNRRVAALGHDVAYWWMEQGHFQRALPVFQAVLPLLDRPVDRLLVRGSIARAAAGVGDRETFDQCWSEVMPSLSHGTSAEGEARALLELATGASTLRLWDQAREAGQRALTVAQQRGEGKVQLTAEALLDSVERRGKMQVQPAATRSADEAGDQLAGDFVRTLTALAA